MSKKWMIETGLRPESAPQEIILTEARLRVEEKNTKGHLPLDITHLYLMLKRESRKLAAVDFYLELDEEQNAVLIKKRNSEPVNVLAKITEAP